MSDQPRSWTIRTLLEWTTPFFTRKGLESPRLRAELLLSHVLQLPRIRLYTEFDREVAAGQLAAYRELVRRAAEHEPVAYLTGRAHFFNLEFDVTRDVLIPRPDTELIVEHVIQLIRRQPGMETPRVLDLCTGTGCIAAAVAAHVKSAIVVAIDISPPAVVVAKKNIEQLKLSERVSVEEGDLFEPLKHRVDQHRFDLIVANPPYIATAQMADLEIGVRQYEPHAALEGGSDGLTLHRRILAGAPDRLAKGGQVFLEIAFDQGELARSLAAENPAYRDAKILKDYSGHDRVLNVTLAD